MTHSLPAYLNKKNIVIFLFLTLQLSIVIFGIRSWPLSDWCMFSGLADPKTLQTYRIAALTENGDEFWVARKDRLGYSPLDYRLVEAIKSKNQKQILKLLNLTYLKNEKKFQTLNVSEIILYQRSAHSDSVYMRLQPERSQAPWNQ